MDKHVEKSDCLWVEEAASAIKRKGKSISRTSLNTYMNYLHIPRHKFPFDARVYVSKADVARIQELINEAKR